MKIRSISGFYRPFAIQQCRNGNFIVANFLSHPSVGIFSPNFELIGWLTKAGLSQKTPPDSSLFVGPHSIDFDQDENIFIDDYRAKKVLKFSPEGDFLQVLLSADNISPPWLLSGPAMCQISPTGELFVSDYGSHSLQRFSADGKFLGWLGASASEVVGGSWQTEGLPAKSNALGGFTHLHSVGFLPDGNFLVVDTWNHRIQKFSLSGQCLGWLGARSDGGLTSGFVSDGTSAETSAPGGFSAPVSLDIDEDFFVVSEYGNPRIQKFSLNGRFLGWVGGKSASLATDSWDMHGTAVASSIPGAFNHPYDVKSKNGLLMVADSDNNRIQLLEF